ncbi:MAG: hypothetical protein WDZ90_00330 [Candidatus Paceibacterota bacterium]
MELLSTWQDWVLAAGQLSFAVALVPSILSKHKPSAWTSALTALVLTTFVVVFFTLGLLYGAITSGVVAVCWYILLFQKLFKRF